MPDELEERINDLTGHTITFNNGTHNVTKKRHPSNPYYHRVLSNLKEECEGLREEINDLLLIWYSSFCGVPIQRLSDDISIALWGMAQGAPAWPERTERPDV